MKISRALEVPTHKQNAVEMYFGLNTGTVKSFIVSWLTYPEIGGKA